MFATGRCAAFYAIQIDQAERVLALYRETYLDLNVRQFTRSLQKDHGVQLSYTWVKQTLQGTTLIARARIADAGRGGRYQACCCTSMASIAGSPMTVLRFRGDPRRCPQRDLLRAADRRIHPHGGEWTLKKSWKHKASAPCTAIAAVIWSCPGTWAGRSIRTV